MTRPQKRDSLAGYAVAAAIGIAALIVVSLIGMSHANAGGHRQRPVCNVVQAAPVYQQASVVAYPGVIGYQVGQALQQQAVAEYGFRASPSQQRLTFLEGYYEATQRLTDSGDRPAGPPLAPAGGEGQTTEEPQAFSAPFPTPAEPLPAEGFAATHPTLSLACAGCHSGETPKGDLNIGKAVVAAQAKADCPTLLSMVNAIATGDMPKGKPMSEVDRLNAIAELLNQ